MLPRIEIPSNRDYNAQRQGPNGPKGDAQPCVICGRGVARPTWMVRVGDGGSTLVDPRDESSLDGDMGGYPIGGDCLARHPELQAYAELSSNQGAYNTARTIWFGACPVPGYAARTRMNAASADLTLAIASNFSTPGERLTRRATEEAGKAYVAVPLRDTSSASWVRTTLQALNDLRRPSITLNIAGNGLHSLREMSQAEVDARVFALLQAVLKHPDLEPQVRLIRSGGQTGVDEAGIKAAVRLGIPAQVIAPKGWLFRGADGQDIADETSFKDRFA